MGFRYRIPIIFSGLAATDNIELKCPLSPHKEVRMDWEKEKDGSWKIIPITADEEKFLDAVFAALTAWKTLKPKALVKPYQKNLLIVARSRVIMSQILLHFQTCIPP
ncbi:hypothetical protein [Desulfovibrio sp. ZJ200]|uniref:hypothetical protein n=1 Tax=Desulfovibrio sp. ZJ200 TaxID=2709792 RepID=UPI00197D984B|nr:hypothetical protein [Desulfovibrio sp. ZJ200]